MADSRVSRKRPTINLSLFDDNTAKSTTNKSPRSFNPNGIVGLEFVAAMNELDQTQDPLFSAKSSRAAILAVSPRSAPIAILNTTIAGAKFGAGAGKFGRPTSPQQDMELSEDYTCVISHVGNNLVKKREYFDDVLANESESSVNCWASSEVFSVSSPAPVECFASETAAEEKPVFRTADFLNYCNLCRKQLHGMDIFIYRGEKAFCSAECRCKQISIDEQKEKCSLGAMKSLEYSASPCSSPMQFFAGMAAA
ncbi:hypothetical protein NMG60_11023843 [Bertholletia excelsa]